VKLFGFRLFVVLASALVTAPLFAAFHEMKITQVFPGTSDTPGAQYVELQMYSPGQNFVRGHSIVVYNAAGAEIQRFTFPGDVANGANQATILVATAQAQTLFNLSADLTMNAVIAPAGGKVCFDDPFPIDCVAWGNYTGSSTGVGTPFNATGGLSLGQAIRRRLDIAGSTTTLEAADDTDNSANDFVFAAPVPRNNAGASSSLTSTSLTSSQNPSPAGQAVTFTATVSAPTGIPNGDVVFKDGASTLATVALDSAGVAEHTTSSLSSGAHSISAHYQGATGFAASSSPTLTQVVQAVRVWVATTGIDSNPCSRALPCRTFAAAEGMVNPAGEIVVLDSGGYGPVTLTKGVTVLAPSGIHAAIAPTTGNAITISAGAGDAVILRGLYLNSQGGVNGVAYQSGGALHIESCVISGFMDSGVVFEAPGELFVSESILRSNNGNGVQIQTLSGTAKGVIERSRLEANTAGVLVGAGSSVEVRRSVSSRNFLGFYAAADSARLHIDASSAFGGDTGVLVLGGGRVAISRSFVGTNLKGISVEGEGSTVRVTATTITANELGVSTALSGAAISFGNNRLDGNDVDGAFTTTLPLE